MVTILHTQHYARFFVFKSSLHRASCVCIDADLTLYSKKIGWQNLDLLNLSDTVSSAHTSQNVTMFTHLSHNTLAANNRAFQVLPQDSVHVIFNSIFNVI